MKTTQQSYRAPTLARRARESYAYQNLISKIAHIISTPNNTAQTIKVCQPRTFQKFYVKFFAVSTCRRQQRPSLQLIRVSIHIDNFKLFISFRNSLLARKESCWSHAYTYMRPPSYFIPERYDPPPPNAVIFNHLPSPSDNFTFWGFCWQRLRL